MIKKRIFIPLTLIIVFLVSIACSIGSLASTVRVYDSIGHLDTAERSALESKLAEAEAECGVAIRVYICDEYMLSERSVLRAVGMTIDDDVIILAVECVYGEYYYELFAYGEGDRYLSDSASEDILDSSVVYGNIKSGNLYEGALGFAEMSADYVNEGRFSSLVTVIVVSVILALIAGGVFFGVTLYRYKKKLKSAVYPVSNYASLELLHSSDNFIGSYVTRTRVSSSSSRGGGGGGGGSRGRR